MDLQGQLSSQRGLLRECIRIQFPCGPLLADFLQRNAESHEIVHHFDEYFDGQDGTLLKQNWWLRLRDQKTLSMKVERSANEASPIQGRIHFEEITDESQILERIRSHLPYTQRLEQGKPLSLLDLALRPRARFAFVRHVFGTAYGTIYVDEMALSTKCDDFYVVGTIIVQNTHDVQPALSLLRAMGLNSGPVRSKFVEWLYVRDKELYRQLIHAGVVPDIPYVDVAHFPTTLISKSLDWFQHCNHVLIATDME